MAHRSDTGPFAIIPEWVLDAEVTPRAIQLYAILGRYADNETGECWPARSTLAERMRCSEDTVDRAMKELERLRAVRVIRGLFDPESERQTSNRYFVARAAPARGEGGTGAADPGREDAGLTRTSNELDPENLEEPSSSARDLTRAREGPSADAWAIAKKARARGDLIVHRVDRVARAVQTLLDTGAGVDELAGAVEVMEPHMTVTLGTLGVGMSKWRLARTREREADERADRSKSDLPYIVGKGSGRGSDGVNYDSLR